VSAPVRDIVGALMRDAPALRWYALAAETGWEELVARRLRAAGHESYCPIEATRPLRRRSTSAPRRVAFLPGYLFARLALPRIELRDRRGVIGLVRGAGAVMALPDPVIAAIRACEDRDGVIRGARAPALMFAPGAPVKVTDGAWAGLVGEVMTMRGPERARVLLGRLTTTIGVERLAAV
jgi:transcription antitermination factor NusG